MIGGDYFFNIGKVEIMLKELSTFFWINFVFSLVPKSRDWVPVETPVIGRAITTFLVITEHIILHVFGIIKCKAAIRRRRILPSFENTCGCVSPHL